MQPSTNRTGGVSKQLTLAGIVCGIYPSYQRTVCGVNLIDIDWKPAFMHYMGVGMPEG